MTSSGDLVRACDADRDGLIGCLRAALANIRSVAPVQLAYLYGSIAQGYAGPFSDIDVALVVEREYLAGLQRIDSMRLEFRIAEMIEERCRLAEVDVRIVNEAPVLLQGDVVTDGVLLYEHDADFRVAYETLTRKLAWDFRPMADRLAEAYFEKRLAELKAEGY